MSSAAKWTGPRPLAELVSRVLDPVSAKRGFAVSDLLSNWDTIVGSRYAPFTQPEKLVWAKGQKGGGVLTIRVDGPRAIFLQHEGGQLIDRINGFLGFAAVAELRLIQKPLAKPAKAAAPVAEPSVPAPLAAALDEALLDVDGDSLRDALRKLGEGVIRDRLARP